MATGGWRFGLRCGAFALAAALAAPPVQAQQTETDKRDERQIRDNDIRRAQQSPRLLINNGVIQRERPYDPIGLPVGGLRLFPSLGVNLAYDSNVYNIPGGRGDLVARIEPGLSLRSDWTRHLIQLDASAREERFARVTANDALTYAVAAQGIVDIGGGGHFFASARAAREIEPRGSIGDLFPGGEPIRYRLREATLGGSAFFDGIRAEIDGQARTLDYRDVRYQGTVFSQKFRDRREANGRTEVAVLIGPQLSLFTQVQANDINYRHAAGAADFSSHGGAAIGGIAFQILGLLSGEGGIGYLRQQYDTLPLPAVQGLSYDLSLVWNIEPVLTLTVRAQRTIQQTPFIETPAAVASTSTGRIDYELLRNVLVNLTLAVTDYDYGRTRRKDRLYNGNLSFRFLLSRLLSAEVAAEVRGQDARSPFSRTYHGSSVRIGLTAQR